MFRPETRDGYIRARIEPRKELPKYKTKAEYAASRK